MGAVKHCPFFIKKQRIIRSYYCNKKKIVVVYFCMETKEKFEISELEKFLKKHELEHIHSDVFERIVILVIAALGLIAALAWDEALKHIFEEIFGGKGTLGEEISYAVTITIITAFISVRLGRFFPKRKKK